MKILIMSVADKRHMSMVSVYTDYLLNRGISFDIIRSNRYDSEHDSVRCISNGLGYIYEIPMLLQMNATKMSKIRFFLRFRREALRLIREHSYDYIVLWNENTAALFSDFLLRSFRGRYCLNVRDVMDGGFLRSIIASVESGADVVVVPSPEMHSAYPDKTLVVLNRDSSILRSWRFRDSLDRCGQPIRITHLGFYSKTKRSADELAMLFSGDSRFHLYFYGAGFDTDFADYLRMNNIDNVTVGGAFPYEMTSQYLSNTDIINSYYNMFNQASLKVSFGVKHSYTPMLKLPSLADEDTCWGRMSRQYGLSYLVNDCNVNSLPDDLFDWYSNIDYEVFCSECDRFNTYIDSTIEGLYRHLDSTILGIV